MEFINIEIIFNGKVDLIKNNFRFTQDKVTEAFF